MTLNKSLAFAGLLFGVATSAIAGDLATPSAIGPVNWSGFYAGIQGGFASGKSSATAIRFYVVIKGLSPRWKTSEPPLTSCPCSTLRPWSVVPFHVTDCT